MPSLTRRQFLRRLLAAALVLAGPTAWATALAPSLLQVTRRRFSLPGVPRLRFLALGDLHRSRWVPDEWIARAVRTGLALRPDLVLLTGDYVTGLGHADGLTDLLAPLTRVPLGAWAVLGNHDHWTEPERIAAALEAAGIRVLRNGAASLLEGRLWLVGLDDAMEAKDDLEGALDGVPPDVPLLLLLHEPDPAEGIASRLARPVLQLSGHSHGGQVRLPLLGAPVLPPLGRRYPAGLYRLGPLTLYTHRGVGLIPPPVRFRCPPEILLGELGPG